MNPIYAQAIAEIRRTNPQRTIFVEPGGWGSIGELKNLVLPPDDNVIVSVHCYDPFYFTHQGATLGRADKRPDWHHFPRPARAAAGAGSEVAVEKLSVGLDRKIQHAAGGEKSEQPAGVHGQIEIRPRVVGLLRATDSSRRIRRVHQSRRAVAREFLFRLPARGGKGKNRLGIWDWSAGFRYWDKKNNAPMPGMHDALFAN